LIFVKIYIVLDLISFFIAEPSNVGSSLVGGIFFLIIALINLPFIIIFPSLSMFANTWEGAGYSGVSGLIFTLIGNAIFYFIIGALIGWIYGKYKNKKNSSIKVEEPVKINTKKIVRNKK
jgi:hypothetical protein